MKNYLISLNPDGTMIAVAQNYDVNIYKVSDGELIFSGKGKKVEFSPSGDMVGIQQTSRLSVYKTNTWELIKDFPQNEESSWDFSPDGTLLAYTFSSGRFESRLNIYSLQNKEMVKQTSEFYSTYIAFSFDGDMLGAFYGPGYIAKAWDTDNFAEIDWNEADIKNWPDDYEILYWKSGIVDQAVSFYQESTIFINKYDDFEVDCFMSNKSTVDCIQDYATRIFSRQGNIWASSNHSGDGDFTVYIFDINASGVNQSGGFSFPATEFGKTMTEKSMSYDLLALDEEQKIALIRKSSYYYPAQSRLIDLTSGSIIEKWTRGLEQSVISPDGHYLAFMYDETVLNIYDLSNRDILGIKEIGSIESLTFSKDSRFLAIAYNNTEGDESVSRVAIFEIEKINDIHYYPLIIFEQPITKTGYFSNEITSIDYSNDNSIIMIGFYDGNVICIDSTDGEELFGWNAHPLGSLLNAKFFPDGKRLITSGSDGSIKIWGLAPYYWQ